MAVRLASPPQAIPPMPFATTATAAARRSSSVSERSEKANESSWRSRAPNPYSPL